MTDSVIKKGGDVINSGGSVAKLLTPSMIVSPMGHGERGGGEGRGERYG